MPGTLVRLALTPKQLGVVMYSAGFLPKGYRHTQNAAKAKEFAAWFDQAIAVAGGESDLKIKALNTNTNGSVDIGIWQINKPAMDETLLKPYQNCTAANALYQSRGWQPWDASKGTHRDSWRGHGREVFAYLESKTDAELKAEALPLGQVDTGEAVADNALMTGLIGDVAGDVIPDWVGSLLAAVALWALPIGVFLLGVILLLLGLWLLAGSPKAAGNLASKFPGV